MVKMGKWITEKLIATTMLLLASFLALFITLAPQAEATNVHGNYLTNQDYCSACHKTHEATGQKLEFQDVEQKVCYYCHGPAGPSSRDIKSQFGESTIGQSTKTSHHPVPEGNIKCTDCHNPHLNTTTTPDLLSSGGQSSGNAYCGSCHTEIVNAEYTGSAHDARLTDPPSSKNIICFRCHQPHGSDLPVLLNPTIKDNGNVSHNVTGNNNTVCGACHLGSVGKFYGTALYNQTAHGSTLISSAARTTWPGTSYGATQCLNCHDPHGTGNLNYQRAAVNTICTTCHDDSSITIPANFSYRGIDAYNNTQHLYSRPTPTTVVYTLGGAGMAAWESNTPPTPSSPTGNAATASQLNQAAANDGTKWVTDVATAEGSFNHQMYKIKVNSVAADITNINLKWIGYGEPKTGYPTSFHIWNFTTSSWEQLNSADLANQGTFTSNIAANFANYVQGNYIYLLAKAKHDGTLPSIVGPSISNTATTATITWTTDEISDTYVEYGPTSSYGSISGSDTLTTSHSVTLSGLTQWQNYHFRLRSKDAVGNEVVSGDYVLDSTTPNITVGPTVPVITDTSATIAWTTDESSTSWVEYGFTTAYGSSAGNDTLVTSHSVSLNLFTPGIYHYKVISYDLRGNRRESADNTFTINTPPTIPGIIDEPDAPSGNQSENVTLQWNASVDPDPGQVQYYVEIWPSGGAASNSGWLNTTSWTYTVTNTNTVTWYWRVKAMDAWGAQSNWSATDSFNHVGPANQPPSTPALIDETNFGNNVYWENVTLQWNASTDPNGNPIQYYVELWGGDNGGNSGWISNTSWTRTIGNYDTVTWYWRVKARDNWGAESAWTYTDWFDHYGEPSGGGCTPVLRFDKEGNATLVSNTPPVKPAPATLWGQLFNAVKSALGETKTVSAPVMVQDEFIPENHYSLNTNYVEVEVTAYDPSVPQGSCIICHSVHGKDSGNGTPIANQLTYKEENSCYGGGTGCHNDGNKSVQGINIKDKFNNANRRTHHSITDAEQTAGGTKIECVSCHDPHLNTRTQKVANPDNRFAAFIPNSNGITDYINASKSVYILVDAKHDGVAPTVTSGPSVSNMAATSATVSWSTNENATSYVEFGTTTSYGSNTTTTALGTNHTVNLTGLTQGQNYHYRLHSTDVLGNHYISGDYVLDATAPTISGHTRSGFNGTSITISWTTNESATTWIDYGLTTSYGTTVGDNILTVSHSRQLTGLTPSTTYYYRIRSADARGNVATITDSFFNTAAPPAPTLIDETNVVDYLYSSGTTLDWNVSVDPEGDTVSYYAQFSADINFLSGVATRDWNTTRSWYVTFSNNDDATYYWRVKAKDNWGAESGWSATDSFVHTGEASPPPDPGCTPILRFNAGEGEGKGIVTVGETSGKQNKDTLWTQLVAAVKGIIGNDIKPDGTKAEPVKPVQKAPETKPFTPESHYSLNTNYIKLRTYSLVNSGDYAPAEAWSSGGVTKPSPTVPGTPYANLSTVNTIDGNRWSTDLTTVNNEYNFQMYRFSVPDTSTNTNSLFLTWTGYGEPTTGYDVAVYLWNFTTSTWDRVSLANRPTESTFNYNKSVDWQTFCNKCHDNSPPGGVVMGSTINISTAYASNDVHGSVAGPLWNTAGTLLAPYQRAMTPLSCADCHDPHGSSNDYHFKSKVNNNNVTVTSYDDNAQVTSYCASCHVGTVTQFHNSCIECHNGAHGNAPTDINVILYSGGKDSCSDCHQHGAKFNFPGHGECGYHSCVPGDMKAF